MSRLPKTPVRVYRNLRRQCYSIWHRGRVVGHRKSLALRDVTFVVRPAGVAHAQYTGHKNVHAFVVGTIVPIGVMGCSHRGGGCLPVRVRYILGRGFMAQSPFSGRVTGAMGAILNRHGLSVANLLRAA